MRGFGYDAKKESATENKPPRPNFGGLYPPKVGAGQG